LLRSDAPLDVAGISKVVFDSSRQVAQVQELLLAQRRAFALCCRDGHLAHTA
jgi:hypothetical protein